MRQPLLQEHCEEEIASQSHHRNNSQQQQSSYSPLLSSTSTTASQQPDPTNNNSENNDNIASIMGSIVQCFLRNCFNEEDEEDNHDNSIISCDQQQFTGSFLSTTFPPSPQNMQLQRDISSSNSNDVITDRAVISELSNGNDHIVENAPSGAVPDFAEGGNTTGTAFSQNDETRNEISSPTEDSSDSANQSEAVRLQPDSNTSNDNRTSHELYSQRNESSNNNESSANPSLGIGIMAFFRHLRDSQSNHGTTTTAVTATNDAIKKQKKEIPYSPLRTAKQFSQRKSNVDIPTLAVDEVVMPGSDLQKEMSEKLKQMGYTAESEEDECVMCMEGFDDTNPRMPTLCGCGENKTFFHLPCLLNYVDQNPNCPVCGEKITWEEF